MQITRSHVKAYLEDVKHSIKNGRYQISPREKNEKLYIDYVFSEDQCKEIILDLEVGDFSEAVQNDHPRFPDEILYIFGKDVTLLPKFGGDEKTVSLYIKFNKMSNQYLIVISFHEQEYPISYKFK